MVRALRPQQQQLSVILQMSANLTSVYVMSTESRHDAAYIDVYL